MLDSLCDSEEELLVLAAASCDFAALGLYSVMTTVTLLTVTSLVCAVLLSTFLSRAGWRRFFSARLSLPSPRGWWWWCLPTGGAGWVLVAAGRNWLATCWATSCGLMRGFRVDVPFRTSHMRHLNASALLRYVHTLQSQKLSSRAAFACRLVRRIGDDFLWSMEAAAAGLALALLRGHRHRGGGRASEDGNAAVITLAERGGHFAARRCWSCRERAAIFRLVCAPRQAPNPLYTNTPSRNVAKRITKYILFKK